MEKKIDVSFEFETRNGIKVILRGMPPLIPQMVANSVPMPDPPTYSVPTADGGEEIWEHDESTLSTPEDRAEWDAYLEAKNKAETDVTEKLLRAILIESVKLDVSEEQVAVWKRKQELIGLPVPADDEELMLHFKEVEVFPDVESIQFIMNKVLELTGVSREDIDLMKDSFPGDVESSAISGSGNEAP